MRGVRYAEKILHSVQVPASKQVQVILRWAKDNLKHIFVDVRATRECTYLGSATLNRSQASSGGTHNLLGGRKSREQNLLNPSW